MKMLYKILNFISKVASYTFAFSLLFILQKYTFGLLIKDVVLFNKIYLYEVLFTASSLYVIKKFIRAYSPYQKYLSKCS